MPRFKHPKPEDMTAFYKNFNSDKYLTKDLMKLYYGDRFLPYLVYQKVDFSKSPNVDQLIANVPVDLLKGQLALQYMERAKSTFELQQIKEAYGKYLTHDEQIARAAAAEVKLVDTRIGTPAFQFNFKDINGANVGLSDLKGKIVLLDLWATWCGPCRMEEPHWEKLNEDYASKSIAFVGISTDKDKSKWNEYVKSKNLKGIQLHAGEVNPLSSAYKVTSIPRYILIDKIGNLISADSPRPSDPKLRTLLDQSLNK